MNLNGKNVLITGGGGFIGSHLAEKLLKLGNNVTVIIRYNSRNDWGNLEYLDKEVLNNLNVIAGNIEDPYCVQKAISKQDVVFHLAALIGIPYSYVAPLNYVKTNIEGTINILDSCLKNNVEKVVHTSTSETYGTALYTPIDEKHPLQGQSPYSASKIAADKLAESYFLSFDLPVTTIRPFNTFGPRQSLRAVIPTIISQALKHDSVKLGSLSPVRDMNYVVNTVNGFIKIAECEHSTGKVINIGSGKALTIGDIANKIFNILGKDVSIIEDDSRIRPEKSEVLKLICDNTLAKELLNWQEEISFDEGLKYTVEFVKNNLDKLKTDIYNV
ncbi:MAG: GDP-mannose 4,6-dehydratase [Cyanobacteriota bacterium]